MLEPEPEAEVELELECAWTWDGCEEEVVEGAVVGVDDVRSPEAPGGLRFAGPAIELEFEMDGGIVGVGGFGGSPWIVRVDVVAVDGAEDDVVGF